MNTQKLQNFIDLVLFDQALVDIEKSIQSVEQKIQKLQDNLDVLNNESETKVSEKKELKKQLDLQELNVKAVQAKETAQIKVVKQAKNSKEYDAANKELEAIRVDRDRQEKKLMSFWNTYEAFEKDLQKVLENQKVKDKEIRDAIVQEKESLELYTKQFKELSDQRNSKIAKVPEEWMSNYNNMRGRVINPVVSVSQDSCSACFYLISSRDLQILKNGTLIQCKSCYRFLYVDTDQKQA